MKNNISKITLISTLLVSNVATAKNFYTCVPKKEWVEKIIQEKEDKNWEFVKEFKYFFIPKSDGIKGDFF